jgi:hypothetical protein
MIVGLGPSIETLLVRELKPALKLVTIRLITVGLFVVRKALIWQMDRQ